jgi:aminopeptidase YwaD
MNIRLLFFFAVVAMLVSACSERIEDARPITVRIAADVRSEYDGERALASVAALDPHIRWPGNRGFDASIDHVIENLEAAGFLAEESAPAHALLTYRVEEYPMENPAWQPTGATLRMEGDSGPLMTFASNRNMLATNSYSTPDEGVVLDIIDVGDGSSDSLDAVDVRGKAILANRDINKLFKDAVVARGAAGVLAYSMPAYTQPEKNREAVQFGDVPYNDFVQSWGIQLSFSAQEKLRGALSKGSVRIRVSSRVEWTPNAIEKTVVAEVRGSERPQERFVFSAHVQEPGANDNASGVAAQLEMARVVATLTKSGAVNAKRTVTFLWGDEFASTQRYVTQDPQRAKHIRWGLSMDMVGQDTARTGGTFLIEKMPDPSAIWTRGDELFSEWGGQAIDKDQLTPH